ncbi:uncharacterized protein G2W53_026324 [Senna tora]|uniref:Uncharacterized protein n=1 Tax=Senna tora TaxID=362788 RepID=A0A834TGZ6_9FABA|nr:uncharacterized protein G2W53_026324 [Senna tora]
MSAFSNPATRLSLLCFDSKLSNKLYGRVDCSSALRNQDI